MGRKKSLSEVQRGQIVALHEEGLSECKIAAKLKVSKTTVHQSIKKFKHGSSMAPTRICIRAEDQEKLQSEMTTR